MKCSTVLMFGCHVKTIESNLVIIFNNTFFTDTAVGKTFAMDVNQTLQNGFYFVCKWF